MTVADTSRWQLTLYVSGASPMSTAAVETARQICDEDLRGQVDLEIVDIGDAGSKAVDDEIVVVPTLVKRTPEPRRKLVGDLSDIKWVRTALGTQPRAHNHIEPEES
jgi:circadian clock protein KaiB